MPRYLGPRIRPSFARPSVFAVRWFSGGSPSNGSLSLTVRLRERCEGPLTGSSAAAPATPARSTPSFAVAGKPATVPRSTAVPAAASNASRACAPAVGALAAVLGLDGRAGGPHQSLAAEQAVDGGLGQDLLGRDLAGLTCQADDPAGGQARVALLEADQQLGDVGRR